MYTNKLTLSSVNRQTTLEKLGVCLHRVNRKPGVTDPHLAVLVGYENSF